MEDDTEITCVLSYRQNSNLKNLNVELNAQSALNTSKT